MGPGVAAAIGDVTKADNNQNLDQPSSWNGGTVPGPADVAIWDATVTGAHSVLLGSDQSYLGVRILNPGGPVTIGGVNTLTLGAGGVDLSAATQNLTLDSLIDLAAANIWNVGAGRQVNVGGVVGSLGGFGLTKRGAGTLTLTNANTYAGGTTVEGGTLALNFAAPGAASSDILASGSALLFGNGTLNVTGAAGASNTQTFGSTTWQTGLSTVNVANGEGGTATLHLGTTFGVIGSAVRFNNLQTQDAAGNTVAATGVVTVGTVATTDGGILGNYAGNEGTTPASTRASAGYATVGLYDFAANDGFGNIVGGSQIPNFYTPLTAGLVNGFGDPNNYDLQANITNSNGGSQKNAGVIRFNTPTATTITGGTSNLFSASSLLVTPNMGANNVLITGGGTYQVIRDAGPNGHQQGVLWQNNTQGFLQITMPITNGRDSNDISHLVKAGAGTVVFSGANSYSGSTHLTEGSLMVSADNHLGAAATPVLLAGGGLIGNGTFTSNATRPISIRSGGGTLSATAGNTMTIAGVVADHATGGAPLTIGSGTVVGTGAGTANATALTGSGTVVLANANTYAGGTVVNNGRLLVSNTTGSGTGTGNVTVNSGAGIGGTGTISGAVSVATGGRVTPGLPGVNNGIGTFTLGSLQLGSSSILDLDISATLNDQIVATNGLNLGGPVGVNLFQAGSTVPFGLNGTFNVFNVTGGAVPSLAAVQSNLSVLNPASGASYTFGLSGSNVTVTIGGLANLATWIANGGGNWSTPANWTPVVPGGAGDAAVFGNAATTPGTASVVLDGGRTVGAITFNNTNGASYAINPGTGSLTLDNLASNAVVTVANGSHAINAPIVLVSHLNLGVTNAADALTIGGDISGAKEVSITSGAGRVIFTGTNSYANTTTVGAGQRLQIGNGGSTGTLGSGSVTNNGELTINRSNAFDLTGPISGTGTLVQAGAGTTTVTSATNAGTWSTRLEAGRLVIGTGSGLGSGSVTTAGSGTLDLNGNSPTIGALAGTDGTVDNSAATPVTLTLNQAANTVFNGTLSNSNAAGPVSVVKSGNGQLNFGGTNTIDGTFTVTAGQVLLNSAAALPAGKTIVNTSTGEGVIIGATTIGGTIVLNPSTSTATALFNVAGGTAATLTGTITTPDALTVNSTQIRIRAGNDANTSLTVRGTGSIQLPARTNTAFAGITALEQGNYVFAENSSLFTRGNAWLGRSAGSTLNFTFRDNATFDALGGITMAQPGAATTAVNLTLQDNAKIRVGTWTAEGIPVTPGDLILNGAATTATTNLNGGSLYVRSLFSNGGGATRLNLNGTQITVGNATIDTFLGTPVTDVTLLPVGTPAINAVVQAGGARINTGVHAVDGTTPLNVSLLAPLVHDATLAGADGGLVKTGAGRLIVAPTTGSNTYNGSTVVNAGTVQLGALAHEPVLGGPNVATPGGADINNKGSVLVFDYAGGTDVTPTVISLLASGRPVNFQAGAQIRTNLGTSKVGIGYRNDLGTSQLSLVPTLYGDTNLDFVVNFDDLLALAQNYSSTATGKVWVEGDSNYDQVVNFDDLLSLAQNYGQSLSLAASQLVDAGFGGGQFAADFALAQSLVPEPGTLGLLGGFLTLAATRRRVTGRVTR